MVNLSRFDLNLLRVFDAVFEWNGVSSAARHLNLSQPAVSHALAKLRAELSDPLFVRQGNRLVPTPVANTIAVPVREALRRIETALASTTTFAPEHSTREFRIGIRATGETPRFSSLFTRVRDKAPNVRLASISFRRRDVYRLLASGECDVIIDIDLPHDDRLCRERLTSEPMAVVARFDHPAIRGGLSLETYLAADHVVASPRPRGAGLEDTVLGQAGLQRRIVARCQHAFTACQIVVGTDLFCTLPRRHAESIAQAWPLAMFDLPVTVPANPVTVYWHRDSSTDPGNVWLRAQIARG